jgi:hypothetical protein
MVDDESRNHLVHPEARSERHEPEARDGEEQDGPQQAADYFSPHFSYPLPRGSRKEE